VDKKDFKDKILAMVRQSIGPSTLFSGIGPCERYSATDYDQYITGDMSPEAIKAFEDHYCQCSSCLKGILESQDRAESEFLFRKTMDLLDKLEKNIIDIVIERSKDFLKIIKTTGEILHTPTALALRGQTGEPKEERSVGVLSEFAYPPISIQASFKIDKPGHGTWLTISVLDKQSEAFMPGVEISLEGLALTKDATTDENGEATFGIEHPGEYLATLRANEEPLGRLDITIKG